VRRRHIDSRIVLSPGRNVLDRFRKIGGRASSPLAVLHGHRRNAALCVAHPVAWTEAMATATAAQEVRVMITLTYSIPDVLRTKRISTSCGGA
jgi:hypothetical protein